MGDSDIGCDGLVSPIPCLVVGIRLDALWVCFLMATSILTESLEAVKRVAKEKSKLRAKRQFILERSLPLSPKPGGNDTFNHLSAGVVFLQKPHVMLPSMARLFNVPNGLSFVHTGQKP